MKYKPTSYYRLKNLKTEGKYVVIEYPVRLVVKLWKMHSPTGTLCGTYYFRGCESVEQ